jgi:putative tryptophan/tyrosine transport system substrate-binding protein
MNKTIRVLVLTTVLMVTAATANAQQPTKTPRVGYLTGASPSYMTTRSEAFRQGLRDLGYVEGKNIVIEWRYADGKLDRLPALAAELIQLKVDIIVTAGGAVTAPVRQATSTIPIVFSQDADPVGNGFVASLARPGGNITELSNMSSDLVGKRLELLKEIVPKLSRVAVFGTSDNRDNAREVRDIENTAAAFAVKTQYVDILSPKDIETAFRTVAKSRVDAVLWLVSGPLATNLKEIAEQAVKYRMPAIYTLATFVDAGGLMNYGVNLPDLDRRAATYVDKILKGIKPADIPVEQPIKFEFVINLKAAKQIGLTISPEVLARANRVIR